MTTTHLILIPLLTYLLAYIAYRIGHKHGYTHGAYDKETEIRKHNHLINKNTINQKTKMYNEHTTYKP